jgi:TonB-dependent siderophore receptor
MPRPSLFCGASAASLLLVLSPFGAWAQTSLPSIDVGNPKQITRSAAKAKPAPHTGASHVAQGGRGNSAPVAGEGTAGAGETGGGEGGDNYGGAGPAQSPYNKTYVLQNASTGTKTDTPVMDTPLNVQSVTQQVLRDQQVTTLGEALKNVSGVFVQSGTVNGNGTPGSRITIRGFPVTTIYRDGFRLDSSQQQSDFMSWLQFANVASVEVLKGPGAVLYGISEPGGVINIVTKEPLDAPYYSVQQQIGKYNVYRTTGDVTGPVTDDKSVLYRMNMSFESNGAPYGYPIDFVNSRNVFLAPVVKWIPDDSTWVKLEASYAQNRANPYFQDIPTAYDIFLPIPRSFNYGGPGSVETQRWLFSALTWSHKFDNDWSVKQQIAYNRIDVQNQLSWLDVPVDSTNGNGTVLLRNHQYLSQPQTTLSTNVDITGHLDTFGAKHTLLIGGDVYKTFGDYEFSTLYDFSQIGLFTPFHPGLPLVGGPGNFANTFDQDTAGLYVQDQVKLPYNIFLLAGARYQFIHQTDANGAILDALTPSASLTAQAVTPRFGLLWQPKEWLSFYGNYTESFGPNSPTNLIYPGNLPPPTSAQSWESGFKLEFFDGKLRATADYFYLLKNNITTPDPNLAHNCGGGPGSCWVLSGEARSQGVELDIQGQILPGWDVIASYTNQDVRVVSEKGGWFGVQPAGEQFAGVPQNLANLWTTYEFQNDALKGLKVGAGYTYHGAQKYIDWPTYLNYDQYFLRPLPSYGTVDLMGAYSFTIADTKLTAQANITNLFNRTYTSDAVIYPPGNYLGASFPAGYSTARRSYGAPFGVMGSLRAEYAGSPAPITGPFATSANFPFDWTGVYLGGQIGYGWADNSGRGFASTPGGLFAAGPVSDAQGVIGGGHVGYNYQFDQWVLGVEGSVDGATISRDTLIPVVDPTGAGSGAGSLTGTFRSDLQGSVRARAGYTFDRLLVYGTGGLAIGQFSSQLSLAGVDLIGLFYSATGERSSTRTGWTAGGGFEYALNTHWSLRSEYRYSDFGYWRDDYPVAVDGYQLTATRHVSQNQVQVGFSYKFGGPEPDPAAAIVKGPSPAVAPVFKSAATPPVAPPAPLGPIDWTGVYTGLQIGYGWGDNDGSLTYATPGGLWGQSGLNSDAIGVSGSKSLNGDAQGIIAGAHMGYNKQFDRWVVGVEGAVDPTLMTRRLTILVPDTGADPDGSLRIGATATGSVWSSLQGSLRARAGYALDRVLFYGSGGAAFGAFSSSFQLYGMDLSLAPFYAANMHSSTRVGWTAGGGVEYAINPHWSVRGEYRYSDFGHLKDFPAPSSLGATYAADRRLDQNQVQLGLSYKFGEAAQAAPVAAKY